MKVAVLSESAADEAAIRILVEAVLGNPIDAIEALPRLEFRTRGWDSLLKLTPTAVKYLHYRTDADGLVMVLDSNHTPVHDGSHELPNLPDDQCRVCRLRRGIEGARIHLRPVHGRTPLRVAVGLAVPCIEAWYLCGIDAHVTEAAWIQGLRSRSDPYTRNQLKQRAYGTDRPSLEQEVRAAHEAGLRLAGDLGHLETRFPNGFGLLADALRGW